MKKSEKIWRQSDEMFHDVSAAIAIPDYHIRQNILFSFPRYGIRDIMTCDSAEHLGKVLSDSSPGLVICDLELNAADLLDIAQSVRLGRTKCPAYAVLVAIGEGEKPDVIHRALSAGFDDIIIKPISIGTLMDRLEYLLGYRKPFVFDAAYLGPDRRGSNDKSGLRTKKATLVAAPNPLAPEDVDMDVKAKFLSALDRVRSVRLEHIHEEVADETPRIIDDLLRELSGGDKETDTRPLAPELRELLISYRNFFEQKDIAALQKADEQLLKMITEIEHHHQEAWRDDFDLLHHFIALLEKAHWS